MWKTIVALCGAVMTVAKPLWAVPRDQAVERAKRKGQRHDESNEILETLPGWGRRPARVKDVTDRAVLNIHESIPLPSDAGADLSRDLPLYVLRDIDNDLRTFLAVATRTGGFALLIGPAAAGKTRCASEALRAVLPGWTFLMPDNGQQINTLVDDHTDLGRSVIWLNETQNFLTGSTPLSYAALRRVLADSRPTVVIGTIWRERFNQIRDETPRTPPAHQTPADSKATDTTSPIPTSGDGTQPQGAEGMERNARNVLSLATTFALDDFSEAEWNRAVALSAEDPRLRIVVEHRADAQTATELLACQPELINRWHHGGNPYGCAVVTAAVTARRCGHPPIVPDTLLKPLAEHLLTGRQLANADPSTWYEQALAWARKPVLPGTHISPLTPHADTPGTITGHQASDILTDHPHTPPDTALWELVITHTTDAGALLNIGDTADDNNVEAAARSAWRSAADKGNLKAQSRLATALGESGGHTGAVTAYEALVALVTRELGPDHPDTLTTRHELAYWRGQAGDHTGAINDYIKLLPDEERILGPDHPNTLTTRHNLAHERGQTGDHTAAVEGFTSLLADRQRILGPDHPNTLTTRHNLAYWRGETGDHTGAINDYTSLLADRQRILGPDHPNTLTTRHDLAYERGETGDHTAAIEGFTSLLADRQRILGPDHPSTLNTRHNLIHQHGEAGDHTAAIDDYTSLLADRQRILGPDHPNTLNTRHNLAHERGQTGDHTAAIDDYTSLLADQERILGPDHPDTLTTRHNLIHQHGEAGDHTAAIDDYTSLLADQERILGPDHPDTLTTRHSLAYQRAKAGDHTSAIEGLTSLLADLERVLGPDHPDTLTTRHNLAKLQQHDAG